MTGVAEGWYEDPEDPLQLRWWDGAGWTDHLTDAPPATPAVALPMPAPAFVPVAPPSFVPQATVAPEPALATWGTAAAPAAPIAQPTAAVGQPLSAPAPVVRELLVRRTTGQRVLSVALRTLAAVAIVVANGVAAVVVVNDGLAEVEVASDDAPVASEEAPELYDSLATIPPAVGTPTWTPTPLVEPAEGELYETGGSYAVILVGPSWESTDRDSGHRGWEIYDENDALIGVAEIEVRQSTQPADLIGLANALAAEPDQYLGGGTTSNHSLLGDPASPTAMTRFDFVGVDPTQLVRVWMTVGSGPGGTTESIIRLYASDASFAAAAWAVEAHCESMAATAPV